MLYILVLTILSTSLTTLSFAERLRDQLVLGSAMLAEIKQECAKFKTEWNFEALEQKLFDEPIPFYIRVADKFFNQSKETRTATLWRETGAALNELLYTLMPFNTFGSAALWDDEAVQKHLLELYGLTNRIAFNRSMDLLARTHQELDAKIKSAHTWWWPTQNYSVFKDEYGVLEIIIRFALDELLPLRVLILYVESIRPAYGASPFTYLLPAIEKVIKQLEKIHWLIKPRQLDTPSFTLWYNTMRKEALYKTIMRCVPPLRPMAAQY